jgi:hypothetical protein
MAWLGIGNDVVLAIATLMDSDAVGCGAFEVTAVVDKDEEEMMKELDRWLVVSDTVPSTSPT